MLFVTVILCTPTSNAQVLISICKLFGMNDNNIQDGIIAQKFISIGALAFLNSFLIPNLVYNLSELMFFETNSRKDRSKLPKYFGYLLINSIILPISQIGEIVHFIDKAMSHEGRQDIQKRLNQNMIV